MATVNRYEGDGSTTSFAVTFTQYSWTSIVVLLDQVEQTTGFTYNSVTKAIVFDTAPADGVVITLRRLSSVDLLYKFSEGAAFTGVNLDADFNQFASAVEEVNDAVDQYYVDDKLNAEIEARQEADASLQSQIIGASPILANEMSVVTWHGQEITNSVDVPAHMNAFSVGPQISIAPGQVVNLGEGSHWSILGNAFEIDELYNLTANNITTSDGAHTVSVETLAGLDGRTTTLESEVSTNTTAISGLGTRLTTEENKTQPITLGGTGATTAAAARTNLGLGTMATQAASAVAITGGTVAGITDLAVADGGTGASTAANARTNLGAAASGVNTDITSITGSAAKLTTARAFRTNLAATTAANFDGSADVNPGVTGTLPIANGGTGGATIAAAMAALGNLYASGVLTLQNSTGTPVKIQCGTIAGTTDASGNLTVTYPSAFTSSVLTVIAMNGESGSGDIVVSIYNFSATNLTNFSAHFSSSVSAARRVNWIAIGI